jgi:membrane fusion protein (multidrug efflux system)
MPKHLASCRNTFLLFAIALALISGSDGACAQGGPGSMPPPEVTVVEVKAGPVPLSFEYAARVAASREVQVRAQVGGILLKRNFVEGAAVKAGDVLFEIDPAVYKAELAKAHAQLQQAEAQLSQAAREADRMTRLFATGSGTEKARDDALSAQQLASATVAGAKAQVMAAQLQVDYTRVTAPIGGRTSQERVPEGSLISTAGDAGLLTRITQDDPAYINFSVNESEFSAVRALLESQGQWDKAADLIKLQILFGDGSEYGQTGIIDFLSSGLDPETGTLRLRGVVANPERRLLPGLFVRAVVTGITLSSAVVVPRAAVSQGPQGTFVYTLGSESKAEIRPIVLGREVADGWVVESGLNPGDKLITEGLIKVRPGAPVKVSAAVAGGARP